MNGSLGLAFHALRRNILRSALTTLGIVIGVGAVIAMVEIGQGSKRAVAESIHTLGANNLLIMPGQAASGPGLEGVAPRPNRRAAVQVTATVGKHRVEITPRNVDDDFDRRGKGAVTGVPDRYNRKSELTFDVPAGGTDKVEFALTAP